MVSSGLRVCSSAPEAYTTVRPRRAELMPQAVETVPASATQILAEVVWSREIPPMLAALARRAVTGLALVAGVVTLTFFLLQLAPGDPVERLLGPAATPEQVLAQRRAFGLDRPLMAQYAAWLGRFARGDWGRSITTGRPVLRIEDLIVAFRTVDNARQGGISCSIDPTPEGQQRYEALMAKGLKAGAGAVSSGHSCCDLDH